MTTNRRSRGILSDPINLNESKVRRKQYPKVHADIGLTVTHQASGVVAAIVEWTQDVITIRDDSGRDRRVRNVAGAFWLDGKPVDLVKPRQIDSTTVSSSGSIKNAAEPARMARASRLLVEGVHDAELLEKVWGDDLRSVGIVVEPMGGADDLAEIVRTFKPGPGRRLGILLDHLVENSKETRIAREIDHRDVLILGHEFVDVWEAVRPRVIGIDAWPQIPMGTPWKEGICEALGAEHPARFWRELLNKVDSFKDLEVSLVQAVEQLIDFVTDEQG